MYLSVSDIRLWFRTSSVDLLARALRASCFFYFWLFSFISLVFCAMSGSGWNARPVRLPFDEIEYNPGMPIESSEAAVLWIASQTTPWIWAERVALNVLKPPTCNADTYYNVKIVNLVGSIIYLGSTSEKLVIDEAADLIIQAASPQSASATNGFSFEAHEAASIMNPSMVRSGAWLWCATEKGDQPIFRALALASAKVTINRHGLDAEELEEFRPYVHNHDIAAAILQKVENIDRVEATQDLIETLAEEDTDIDENS